MCLAIQLESWPKPDVETKRKMQVSTTIRDYAKITRNCKIVQHITFCQILYFIRWHCTLNWYLWTNVMGQALNRLAPCSRGVPGNRDQFAWGKWPLWKAHSIVSYPTEVPPLHKSDRHKLHPQNLHVLPNPELTTAATDQWTNDSSTLCLTRQPWDSTKREIWWKGTSFILLLISVHSTVQSRAKADQPLP